MLLYLHDLGIKTWAYHVKELLCRNGFVDVWLQQNVGHLNRFVSVSKQRLLDQFQRDWSGSITSTERYEFDSIFKHSIHAENYIDFIQLRCFRKAYIQFIVGISPISVHRLRYRDGVIPRDLLCPVCKDEIEDETHVLFSCKVCEEFGRDVQWFGGYTRQRLLMFQTLCQLMTKGLFANFPVLLLFFCCCCTELCKEETTLQLHKVAQKTCM